MKNGGWYAVLLVELWFLGPGIALGLVMAVQALIEQPTLLLMPLALALLVVTRLANDERRVIEMGADSRARLAELDQMITATQNALFPVSETHRTTEEK